jgi:arylsulfatase A-like enzyme
MTYKICKIITVLFCVFIFSCKAYNSFGIAGKRPNIIIILADDLGYMDLNGYAQNVLKTPVEEMYYETPAIDQLMKEGMSFSSAYVCPLCSPTRSSLLTGKYAARMGFTTAMGHEATWYNTNEKIPEGAYIHDALNHVDPISIQQAWINGKSNSALPAGLPIDKGRKEILLPEVLDGYHTAFIGKWHVGGFGADGYQPADRGFDEVPAYSDAGASPYFNWRDGWNNRSIARFPEIPQREIKRGDAGKYSGEQYLTDDLTRKALDYIDNKVDNKEGPFFLYLNHFAVHAPIQARKGDIDYFKIKETKGWNGHKSPAYAGLVKGLDDSVGKILQKLEEKGIEEETLVVFMSDNGGVDYDASKQYGTKNSPYLGGKATLFEGGIKTPLIFRWKGKIDENKWCNVSVDVNDLFPTILEIAGIVPEPFYQQHKIDGRSFVPLFSDTKNVENKYRRNVFFWHYPFNVIFRNPVDNLPLTPHSAVREGNMKLIFDWHGRLYLFNLAVDPYEKDNLAEREPEIAQALFSKLVIWLENNVEDRYWPKINPKYESLKEPRHHVPFVDLIKIYQSGGDVVKVATIPEMSEKKFK